VQWRISGLRRVERESAWGTCAPAYDDAPVGAASMNNSDSSIPKRRRDTRLHPSAFLLAAQLLSLVLYARFDGHSTGSALLSAFGILVLALIVWVVNHSPGLNWIAWLLVVPAVILSILTALVISPSIMMWSSLVESVLYFYATGT
jgi:hypothetical protein